MLKEDRQWQEVWSGPEIRGGQPIRFDEISLSGATAMALTVDYGEGGDVLGRVNWLMPRISN